MYWYKFIVFDLFQLVPGRYVVELGYTSKKYEGYLIIDS